MSHGISLVADVNNGEGSLRITAQWKALPAITRADIMRDWMFDLHHEYYEIIKEMQEEFEKKREAKA